MEVPGTSGKLGGLLKKGMPPFTVAVGSDALLVAKDTDEMTDDDKEREEDNAVATGLTVKNGEDDAAEAAADGASDIKERKKTREGKKGKSGKKNPQLALYACILYIVVADDRGKRRKWVKSCRTAQTHTHTPIQSVLSFIQF